MAEQKVSQKSKNQTKEKKWNVKVGSVRAYGQAIEGEKQEMATYSRKMKSNVRALQADFKKHAKDIKAAAIAIREEGIKNMSGKIRGQIKENKEAIANIANGVKYLIGQCDKKKKERGYYNRYMEARY